MDLDPSLILCILTLLSAFVLGSCYLLPATDRLAFLTAVVRAAGRRVAPR
jgi:hypothetical protein